MIPSNTTQQPTGCPRLSVKDVSQIGSFEPMRIRVHSVLVVATSLASCSKVDGEPGSVGARADRQAVPAPALAASKFSVVQVEAGRALHALILGRHPGVERFYKRATLWGAMTESPLVIISVPSADWRALSSAEQESLKAYAASCVEAVRASPFSYTNIPASAPLAPTIRQKAAAMTANSWGIMAGAISSDGRDIMSDDVVVRGQ